MHFLLNLTDFRPSNIKYVKKKLEKLKRKFEYDEAEIRTLKTDIEKAAENKTSAEANMNALMEEVERISQLIGNINVFPFYSEKKLISEL